MQFFVSPVKSRKCYLIKSFLKLAKCLLKEATVHLYVKLYFRFPVKLDMTVTEEVTVNRGEDYKLEVGDDHYNFYWRLKGEWLLLFRFGRDKTTGSPIKSDHKMVLQLCQEVYTSPDYIPIRDEYVLVSSQTNDSKINFSFMEGQYSYKVFNKSQLVEAKTGLDNRTFFQLLNKMCKMDVQPIDLPSK